MFWDLYGKMIVDAVLGLIGAGLTAVAGYIALQVKEYINSKKQDMVISNIVKTAVQAGEQMYKEYHGEDKLNLVLEGASEMLAEKGIEVSDFELRWLIESAVGEFNNVFYKTSVTDGEKSIEE